jgi:DNA-directed RNA polymerase subunit L
MSDELNYQQEMQQDHDFMNVLREHIGVRDMLGAVYFERHNINGVPNLIPMVRMEAYLDDRRRAALDALVQERKELVEALRDLDKADMDPDEVLAQRVFDLLKRFKHV